MKITALSAAQHNKTARFVFYVSMEIPLVGSWLAVFKTIESKSSDEAILAQVSPTFDLILESQPGLLLPVTHWNKRRLENSMKAGNTLKTSLTV